MMKLVNLFEKSPVAKMLDYLIDEYKKNPSLDHSRDEMGEYTGLTGRTVIRYIGILKQAGIIEVTRLLGNLEMFKLSDCHLVTLLLNMRKDLEHKGDQHDPNSS